MKGADLPSRAHVSRPWGSLDVSARATAGKQESGPGPRLAGASWLAHRPRRYSVSVTRSPIDLYPVSVNRSATFLHGIFGVGRRTHESGVFLHALALILRKRIKHATIHASNTERSWKRNRLSASSGCRSRCLSRSIDWPVRNT